MIRVQFRTDKESQAGDQVLRGVIDKHIVNSGTVVPRSATTHSLQDPRKLTRANVQKTIHHDTASFVTEVEQLQTATLETRVAIHSTARVEVTPNDHMAKFRELTDGRHEFSEGNRTRTLCRKTRGK